MNVSMSKSDAVSARLTVAVEESDYRPKVIEDLKKIGRTHQIPGFRKGHVALKDLERRFGKDVTSDVINREVFEAVMKFIEDNKLNVLGQPVPVEVKALDFSQKDFTFEYDLALAPELDIKLDKDERFPTTRFRSATKWLPSRMRLCANASARRFPVKCLKKTLL